MEAIVVTEFGGPGVLHVENVPTPKPATGEVLVKVHSVSINRTLDLVVRAGNYPVKIQMPHILGVDPAGVLVEVGEGVDKAKAGDRVAVISSIMQNVQAMSSRRGNQLSCEPADWTSPLGRLRGVRRRAGNECVQTA